MLVKCPKCHFEQPQDRFCANCGIDMESFKPHETLGHRVTSNSLFYVFLIGLVVAATGVLLYRQLSPKTPTGLQENNAETLVKTQKKAEVSDKREKANPSEMAEPEQKVVAARTLETPKPMEGFAPPAAKRAAEPTPPKLPIFTLRFYEVQPEFLRDLQDERVSGDNLSGMISDWSDFMSRRQRNTLVEALGTPSTHPVTTADQPLIFFKGTRDNRLQAPVGLFFQILPLGTDDRGFHFRLEIKHTLAGGTAEQPQPDTAENTREFLLHKKSAAYILGSLPHHRKPFEWEEALFSGNFLKVLLSDRFQEAITEFVVVLEATEIPRLAE